MTSCEHKTVESCPHIKQSADAAVKKVFAILGVDINDPRDVEKFREDLRFGGKLRRAADHGFLTMVAAILVGALAVIWVGITAKLAGGN